MQTYRYDASQHIEPVTPVAPADAGVFDFVITNIFSAIVTKPAESIVNLTVSVPPESDVPIVHIPGV